MQFSRQNLKEGMQNKITLKKKAKRQQKDTSKNIPRSEEKKNKIKE